MIRKIFFALVFVLFSLGTALSQQVASDFALLSSNAKPAIANYYNRSGNNREVLEVHRKSFFSSYNPVTLLLKGSMYTYQHVISPQLSRSCPYEITCSNFSKQSIKEFGIVKGMFLSADRILRCNRIGVMDVHPLDFNDLNGTIADSPNKYR